MGVTDLGESVVGILRHLTVTIAPQCWCQPVLTGFLNGFIERDFPRYTVRPFKVNNSINGFYLL